MFLSTSLNHYKRLQVRKALIEQSSNKEVSVMYGIGKFGKRPDVLIYENDVLELAKNKVSSFHCSEESWHNPLSITTGMKRHELDDLRTGWDLILDIDCPDWPLAKLTTHLFIKSLQDHGIKAISVKFSGNKGFHIAVPFEAFPKQIMFDGELKDLKNIFPEGPRKIAFYLLEYITQQYASLLQDSIILDGVTFTFDELRSIAKKTTQSLFIFLCSTCKKEFEHQPRQQKPSYVCARCGHSSNPQGSPEIIKCEHCKFPVEQQVNTSKSCPFCHSKTPLERHFNWLAVVDVDTVLIASRHLYRMPYSLHEKSGLVSIPLPLDGVLSFEKDDAKPENISFDIPFLDRSKADPALGVYLLGEAFSRDLQNLSYIPDEKFSQVIQKPIELPKDAISEEFFPPCIKLLSQPLKDGKKRALFILINFLRVSSWSIEQIEDFIFKWNNLHPEPLREQYLRGQLFQIKKGKQALPPPNCDNKDYYSSLLVCQPDNFCSRVRNPAMYAKRKYDFAQNSKKAKSSTKKVVSSKKTVKKGKKEEQKKDKKK